MVDFVEMLEREERLLGGRITDYKPAATVKAKKEKAAEKAKRIGWTSP
jgi:hypothetical protein